MLTREYPPEVYGGAGVHVENLSRELALLAGVEVGVHCFGGERSDPLVRASYPFPDPSLPAAVPSALAVMDTDLRMAAGVGGGSGGGSGGVDVVHSHTWYTNFAGHLVKLSAKVPHVVTAHSLEPLRPWKADQLGSGYALSTFCEQTAIEHADAVIAVSGAMAADIASAYPAVDPPRIAVVHNGIDPDEYRPDPGTDVLAALGVEPGLPTVMWVGRVTPQKGVEHLLDMAARLPPEVQFVFLAGASDTPEYGAAMNGRAGALAATHPHVHWVERMLAKAEVVQLLSHASVFVCPSVYEPFGLINLEAMACGVPVVATAVGGIPEIVVESTTGHLVPVPEDAAGLGASLAASVAPLLEDPARAEAMGAAGRARVLERFTWRAVAEQTAALYRSLLR